MEFTLEELQALASLLIRERAKTDYNIDQLEEAFKDHVVLYQNETYTKHLKKRDLLAGLATKMINCIAMEQVRVKTLMN